MTAVAAFVAGMVVGSLLILTFGAIVAASNASKDEEWREIQENNRRYINKLEQELYGFKFGDDE